jgi:N-acetylmuramoyl-L-alanine amidase
MTDGERLLALAATRIGQKYVNVLVPKNNPNWQGPWDCAEFMSWLVYQIGGFLYGCVDNQGNPATTEAYTGAWQHDVQTLGRKIDWREAANIKGAMLLRYPPAPGSMGHIVVSDGAGGTVEAMGKAYGVRRGKVTGRVWNTGVLVPGLTYPEPAAPASELAEPMRAYRIGAENMDAGTITEIQQALAAAGFDPGPVDGDYGHNTAAAVAAYQAVRGLTVDGQVGPRTARRLGVTLI